MIILGIETSCDETGVCIIEVKNDQVKVLGNQLYSQIAKHQEFGGVMPMLAKREHAKNLVPLLKRCLEETKLFVESISYPVDSTNSTQSTIYNLQSIKDILSREPELLAELLKLLETIEKPRIDAISVTNGPGLEPALWVGVTFAKALSTAWNIPLIATNHMEGHIVVSSLQKVDSSKYRVDNMDTNSLQTTIYKLHTTIYPAIALLISGGHTQLVFIKGPMDYKIVGGTRDDAVGEAFDKVARMLGLPYPGGPQISLYADKWKNPNSEVKLTTGQERISTGKFKFPRPMINSKDLDFSFSGLKTSVLYRIKEIGELTLNSSSKDESGEHFSEKSVLAEEMKQEIAFEFKEAVIDVLISKTKSAILEYGAQTLIVGGGVIADKNIRLALENLSKELNVKFQLPEISASTDNALMIALAGYMNILAGKKSVADFKANGNLSL